MLGASCVITDQAHRSVMEEIFPASSILLVEELMISQEDQSQLAAIRAAMIDTDPLYVNFYLRLHGAAQRSAGEPPLGAGFH